MQVTVLADSICPKGNRLLTLELTYPLIIHGQVMTHRVFSRNAASNRAIPTRTLLWNTLRKPFVPKIWGENKRGMQAGEPLSLWRVAILKSLHYLGLGVMGGIAQLASWVGLHKQHANRYLMPYQYITVILSSTEWENFFNLRVDSASQPEMQELARKIKQAYDTSRPKLLKPGMWHLPFVTQEELLSEKYTTTDLKNLSTGRNARVSYLTHLGEYKPESDIKLAGRLQQQQHLSPFEHIATPSSSKEPPKGNFTGWLQYREQVTENSNGN